MPAREAGRLDVRPLEERVRAVELRAFGQRHQATGTGTFGASLTEVDERPLVQQRPESRDGVLRRPVPQVHLPLDLSPHHNKLWQVVGYHLVNPGDKGWREGASERLRLSGIELHNERCENRDEGSKNVVFHASKRRVVEHQPGEVPNFSIRLDQGTHFGQETCPHPLSVKRLPLSLSRLLLQHQRHAQASRGSGTPAMTCVMPSLWPGSQCTGSAALYQEQWLKLLDLGEDIRTFIRENEGRLKKKEPAAGVG